MRTDGQIKRHNRKYTIEIFWFTYAPLYDFNMFWSCKNIIGEYTSVFICKIIAVDGIPKQTTTVTMQ